LYQTWQNASANSYWHTSVFAVTLRVANGIQRNAAACARHAMAAAGDMRQQQPGICNWTVASSG